MRGAARMREIAEALAARGLTAQSLRLYRAIGCDACGKSGYAGRMALHELLIAGDEVRAAIPKRTPVHEVRAIAIEGGMRTLLQDGVEKVLGGLTDLQQVVSVCGR